MTKKTINGVELDISPRANLSDANLYGANLSGANLRGANLYGANLSDANLYGADLSGANLRDASLYGADLSNASLYGANMSDVDLSDAKNVDPLFLAMTNICAEGELIVYKKLRDDVICKLKIPSEAKRSNSTGRKCRFEYAVVLEGEGFSRHDPEFEYRVGETVRPREPFDDNRWEECASGIHAYLTRIEAENN